VVARKEVEHICDDGDDGTREKRRSLLFMGAVGWNGPLKLAYYATLVRLPLIRN